MSTPSPIISKQARIWAAVVAVTLCLAACSSAPDAGDDLAAGPALPLNASLSPSGGDSTGATGTFTTSSTLPGGGTDPDRQADDDPSTSPAGGTSPTGGTSPAGPPPTDPAPTPDPGPGQDPAPDPPSGGGIDDITAPVPGGGVVGPGQGVDQIEGPYDILINPVRAVVAQACRDQSDIPRIFQSGTAAVVADTFGQSPLASSVGPAGGELELEPGLDQLTSFIQTRADGATGHQVVVQVYGFVSGAIEIRWDASTTGKGVLRSPRFHPHDDTSNPCWVELVTSVVLNPVGD